MRKGEVFVTIWVEFVKYQLKSFVKKVDLKGLVFNLGENRGEHTHDDILDRSFALSFALEKGTKELSLTAYLWIRLGIYMATEMQPPLGMNAAAAWSTEQHNTEQHIERWNNLKKTEVKILEGRK